ncbi:hypothetical protein [Haliangium sp.]|uniref:hypothetical protein n=1 Tax=Haliangium sp. TaxID=2663208 RepID=UPI003D0C41C4
MQKITSVAGVLGAAVFDDSGACLAQDLKPPYEAILLTEILGQLGDIYDNYLALAETDAIASLIGTFDGGHVLVRRFGDHTLIVIASEEANLAMLGVSINVALLKLSRAGIAPGGIAPGAPRPPAPPPQAYGSAPRPPYGSTPPPPPPHLRDRVSNSSIPGHSVQNPQVSSSQNMRSSMRGGVDTSTSISWSAEDLGGQRPPPDAVGLAVMRHVLKALARRIGPVDARAILDEELRVIGATPATVRASEFTDIIHNVARRMANQADRSAFIADALGDAGF